MAPILEIQNLRVRFPVFGGLLLRKTGEVPAVDGVSFTLNRGETLGLVGESGCGKTTVGRAIVNILRAMSYRVDIDGRILYSPQPRLAQAAGSIVSDVERSIDSGRPEAFGELRSSGASRGNAVEAPHPNGVVDLMSLSRREMRPYRADIQMIFQDPYSSLNPRMNVGQIIGEPLKIHTRQSPAERRERVRWLMDKVGLAPEYVQRCPHEFSGGQRQRIGIARALATNPKIVIADEPVSALDVSIQAQVINLMQDLQEEFGLSYIFIAHDLSVVRHISDRIIVMYLGNIVEMGPAEQVYTRPMHPYTRALLTAVPRPDPDAGRARRARLRDDVPSPLNKPSGCSFRTRCPIARPSCADDVPPLQLRQGRDVACPWAE